MAKTNSFLDNTFTFLDNAMTRSIIIVLIVIYIVLILPILTNNVKAMLKTALNMLSVRLLLLFIIFIVARKDPLLAFFIVIAFFFSIIHLYNLDLQENMDTEISDTLKKLIDYIQSVQLPKKKNSDLSMNLDDINLNNLVETMQNYVDVNAKASKPTKDDKKIMKKDMKGSDKKESEEGSDMKNSKMKESKMKESDMNNDSRKKLMQNNTAKNGKMNKDNMNKESFQNNMRKGCNNPTGFNSSYADCINNKTNPNACAPCGQVMALNGETGSGEIGPQGLLSTIGYPGYEFAPF